MTTSRLSPFFLATTLSLAAATVSAQQAVADRAPDVTMGLKRDPALAAAIAEISTAQIRSTDSALVSFGTRHTMSDTLSNSRGIGAARRYLFNKLTGYRKACGGCLKVEYDPAMMEMRGHPRQRRRRGRHRRFCERQNFRRRARQRPQPRAGEIRMGDGHHL